MHFTCHMSSVPMISSSRCYYCRRSKTTITMTAAAAATVLATAAATFMCVFVSYCISASCRMSVLRCVPVLCCVPVLRCVCAVRHARVRVHVPVRLCFFVVCLWAGGCQRGCFVDLPATAVPSPASAIPSPTRSRTQAFRGHIVAASCGTSQLTESSAVVSIGIHCCLNGADRTRRVGTDATCRDE